jgi:predicted ester cyclase
MPSRSATAESTVTEVALRYFDAVARRDVDAMVDCWEPGRVDRLVGQGEFVAPDGIRAYFSELFGAFPDFRMEVIATTAEDDRCAVRWRATGTFAGPGTFQGLEPTGGRVELEGCDVVRVSDGLLVGNDAYVDGAQIARQLGVLPGRESAAEQRMTRLVNRRTKLMGRAIASEPERIAEGVWLIRGGFPSKTMNVYLIEEPDGGVCVFDAGIVQMTNAVAAAGARMGGIRRVVLGHGHADHRGVAPYLGAPVFCHPAERADAEGDGAWATSPSAGSTSPPCSRCRGCCAGGTAGRSRSPARSRRASRSPASRSSTCPATRPG